MKYLDGATAVELPNVKTVERLPISKGCVPKQINLEKWPHLQGIDIPELNDGDVMLLIGLKERPRLFLPLESREGGEDEPIAIRYSLGWTVMGPIGGKKEDCDCSVNFTRSRDEILVAEQNYSGVLGYAWRCLDDGQEVLNPDRKRMVAYGED